MEKYRILEHTADGKFQAFGATLEEAFGNAALAVASLMWDWRKIEAYISYPVGVEGHDLKQLLVRFLGEIIFLFETRSFLLGSVEELKISARAGRLGLRARFLGDSVSDRYELHGGVKAVTYHDMKIEKKAGQGYVIQAVVDM